MTEREPRGTRSESHWIAALWVLTIVYFWPVLAGGESFYFRDTYAIYYPQSVLTSEALAAGELPLWEPKIGTGYPYLSDPHSMALYPLSLLLVLLPFPLAYNVFVAIHVPLGGTFLFLLLRRWRLSAPAAALGAVVLMFCGFTISCTMLTTLLRGLIWAPLALYFFDRFLAGEGRQHLAWTAFALALQGSCTDPQYVAFTGAWLAVLPWASPNATTRSLHRVMPAVAGAGALAFAILGYQYLPLGHMFLNSSRASGVVQDERDSFEVDPSSLAYMALPVPFANPDTTQFHTSYRGAKVPFYTDIYFGIPVLCLAISALGMALGGSTPAVPLRSPLTVLGVAVAGIVLSLGNNLPVFGFLNRVFPPLNYFRYPGKYFLLAALSIAIAAAMGFEGLLRERRASRTLFTTLMLLGLLACAGAAGGLWLTGLDFPAAYLNLPGDVPAEIARDRFEQLRDKWMLDLALVGALIVVLQGILFLEGRGKLTSHRALRAAGLIVALDLVLATHPGSASIDREFLERPPAAATIMKGAAGPLPPRFITVFPSDVLFGPGVRAVDVFLLERELVAHLCGAAYELAPIKYGLSVQMAHEARLRRIVESVPDLEGVERIAAAIGAEYIVRPADPRGEPGPERLAGRTNLVAVQRVRGVLPRAFIAASAVPVSATTTLPSARALLELPRRAVYETAGETLEPPGKLAPTRVDRCEIVRYGRHDIALEVGLRGSGLLVLLDTYYPGWRATVDGQARPIYRVAGIFRGIPLREGDRSVRLTYHPRPFWFGVALTGLALVVCGVLLRPRSG